MPEAVRTALNRRWAASCNLNEESGPAPKGLLKLRSEGISCRSSFSRRTTAGARIRLLRRPSASVFLVTAIAEMDASGDEVVSTIAWLVNAGHVKLVGEFREAHIRIG